MLGSRDYWQSASSLATVAIAALGGPLAGAGAAMTEVVKHAQARYEANAPTRDSRNQIAGEIREWARAEGFTGEEVEHGLGLATRTVAQFGVDQDTIATLKYDCGRFRSASWRPPEPQTASGGRRTTTPSQRPRSG